MIRSGNRLTIIWHEPCLFSDTLEKRFSQEFWGLRVFPPSVKSLKILFGYLLFRAIVLLVSVLIFLSLMGANFIDPMVYAPRSVLRIRNTSPSVGFSFMNYDYRLEIKGWVESGQT